MMKGADIYTATLQPILQPDDIIYKLNLVTHDGRRQWWTTMSQAKWRDIHKTCEAPNTER